MTYLVDDASHGMSVMIAERNDGLWIPLMKIAGDLPQPMVLRDGAMIAIGKDLGGNIPSVRTRAWVWNRRGPLLLNAYAAIAEATAKLGTGYSCYGTGLDWESLYTRTLCSHGEVRNKASYHYQLDVWFDLKDAQLLPKRVELWDIAQEGPRDEPKYWP